MRIIFCLLASLGCAVPFVSAAPITYRVSVATSAISGTSGSLDFQFNPGPLATQAATLQIVNFASDGSLDSSNLFTQGDVSGGPLPTPVTFGNGTGTNEYFEGFTYGSSLLFDLSFDGPALTAPNQSPGGSVFAFSMFSDAAGTIPVLTSDSTFGIAFQIQLNPDGTTQVINNSAQTTVIAPEPGTGSLILTAFLIGGLWARRRRTSVPL